MAFPNSRGCELERQVDGLEAELAKTEERHALQIESLQAEVASLKDFLDTVGQEVYNIRIRLDNYNQSHVEVI